MRQFETGATRDSDETKFDYDGFLSPAVIEAFGQYMHNHRKQSDGRLRDSDNWQKGIPQSVYRKSLWRHFWEVWSLHRANKKGPQLMEALMAMLFNIQGLAHELIKENRVPEVADKGCRQEDTFGIGGTIGTYPARPSQSLGPQRGDTQISSHTSPYAPSTTVSQSYLGRGETETPSPIPASRTSDLCTTRATEERQRKQAIVRGVTRTLYQLIERDTY